MKAIDKFNADMNAFCFAYEAAGLADMVRAVRAVQGIAESAIKQAVDEATAPQSSPVKTRAPFRWKSPETHAKAIQRGRNLARRHAEVVAARKDAMNGAAPFSVEG